MAPVGGQKRCAWQRPKFRRRKINHRLFSSLRSDSVLDETKHDRRAVVGHSSESLNAIILSAYYNSLSFLCSFNNRPVSHIEEGVGKC